MSDEEIQPCSMCHKFNDQMLMLSCIHDPCINCAAIHYNETQTRNSQVYRCSRCGEVTELDSSSIVELQKIYDKLTMANVRVQRMQKRKKSKDGIQNREGSYKNIPTCSTASISASAQGIQASFGNQSLSKQSSQLNINSQLTIDSHQKGLATQNGPNGLHFNSKAIENSGKSEPSQANYLGNARSRQNNFSSGSNFFQKRSQIHEEQKKGAYGVGYGRGVERNSCIQPVEVKHMCQDHPEEEISYYCFSCPQAICPQCVIHGRHRSHEVQTTRKSIRVIRNGLQGLAEKVGDGSKQLFAVRDTLKKAGKEVLEMGKKERVQLSELFEEVRIILTEKEKEFSKVVEATVDSNSIAVRNSMAITDRSLETLTCMRKGLDTLAARDDVSVLQEYPSREQNVKDTLDKELSKREDQALLATIKGLDMKLLQQEMLSILANLKALRLTYTKMI